MLDTSSVLPLLTALTLALGSATPSPCDELSRRPLAEVGTLTLTRAGATTGILGTIYDQNDRLLFESQIVGELLMASITDDDGSPLWLYHEGPRLDGDGKILIEIEGVELDFPLDAVALVRLEKLAQSPAGRLIRELAFELERAAPGAALRNHRRGIETAFQVLQVAFGQLSTAGETGDCLWSPAGGFVVKSQHPSAVFQHNMYQGERPHEDHDDDEVPHLATRDDAGRVGDCFGMCGGGCSNFLGCGFEGWTHEWVGQPSVRVSGPSCDHYTSSPYCGHPYGRIDYEWTGDAVHTVRGRTSEGCIAHDGCCRAFPGSCYFFPPCHLLGAQPWLQCGLGLTSPYTASYVGFHRELSYEITDAPEGCGYIDCGGGE